ncbi:hypothetical protein PAMP_011009 [Pampus punctatissimus]
MAGLILPADSLVTSKAGRGGGGGGGGAVTTPSEMKRHKTQAALDTCFTGVAEGTLRTEDALGFVCLSQHDTQSSREPQEQLKKRINTHSSRTGRRAALLIKICLIFLSNVYRRDEKLLTFL